MKGETKLEPGDKESLAYYYTYCYDGTSQYSKKIRIKVIYGFVQHASELKITKD